MTESLARTPGVGLTQAESLARTPEVAKNVLAQYMNPMLPIHRQQMENSAAQHAATLAEQRRMHDQTITQQNRLFDLQAGQIKNASPEGKAMYAERAGIPKGSPEWNEFVYGIKRPDPLDALLSPQPQSTTQPRPTAPAGPPAAMSPAPSMPGPRLMPQSFDGGQPQGGDPNLIRIQAPGATQPAQAQEPMVTLPGGRQVPLSVAEAVQLQAARNKNEPLATLIGQAIGKVPKALQDDIGKGQLAAINQRSRVENIISSYDPEWLTIDGKLRQTGLNWWDSVGPLRDSIPKESREKMSRYNTFTTAAFQNLNDYIKEVTGAAVGVQEESRIRAGVPDPAKDGPQQFLDKSKETLKIAGLFETRMRYMAKNGLKFDKQTVHEDFPISRMEGIIQQRTNELRKILEQRGMTKDEMTPLIQKQLKAEFNT